MKYLSSIIFFLVVFSTVCAQEYAEKMDPEMTEIWEPEVPVITPGENPSDAPFDAIILFDGTNLHDEWVDKNGDSTKWKVDEGVLYAVKGAGVLVTKRKFKDCQLHIEWRTPSEVTGKGQGRGNSGIYMQGFYEIQVLDSYENRTYRNGQAGSIYKQHAPLVNACKAPGEWQSFDIIYRAPVFKADGTYRIPPCMTVLQNGVLIQNHSILRGPTAYVGIPEYKIKVHEARSIKLQDHSNPVAFRNIWIREL